MGEKARYARSSRSCDLLRMTPDLADAIKAWAEDRGQASLLAEVTAGCETRSELVGRRGLLMRMMKMPQRTQMGAVLTPDWLVWAVRPDDDDPTVLGVRLAAVEITDYARSPAAGLVPDAGVYVAGLLGPSLQPGTIFIGLADDRDGRAFKDRLLEAWRATRS